MIAVVDYGLGNLGSVGNALLQLRAKYRITDNSDVIGKSDALILPGDGAAAAGMKNLKKRKLLAPIKTFLNSGKPFLGICLGMQLLLQYSDEGNVSCMGLIEGTVKKFDCGLKIPQIGWNQVRIHNSEFIIQKNARRLFREIPDENYFYFIHSFYCEPKDEKLIVATTDYGRQYCSVLVKGNIIGVQFHPEKSGEAGLLLLKNFASIS